MEMHRRHPTTAGVDGEERTFTPLPGWAENADCAGCCLSHERWNCEAFTVYSSESIVNNLNFPLMTLAFALTIIHLLKCRLSV